MSYLYLLLNLGSLSIPFFYSFHPKLKFYSLWKSLFIGIFVMMCIFLPWDIFFTQAGFWGFNSKYLLGPSLFHLPIEEWLFFICIPYACVFTHYALLYYFPKMQLGSDKVTYSFTVAIIIALLLLAFVNSEKWYTLVNFLFGAVLLLFALTELQLLKRYYLTFLVMLIPFFLVNGILTGSFIVEEVVWYNNLENLGIRLFTIPVEDTVYAFSMILTVLLVIEKTKNENLVATS